MDSQDEMNSYWTSTPPKQSGWYWYKSARGRISMIYAKSGNSISLLEQCTIENPEGNFIDAFKGSWSPELIPPEDRE